MISVMHSKHPETILPPLDCEKIVFRETCPCCQRGCTTPSYHQNCASFLMLQIKSDFLSLFLREIKTMLTHIP